MQQMLQPATTRRSRAAMIVILPMVFLLLGLALRFLAFRMSRPELDPSGFIQSMCRWDCGWYIKLAQTGYDPYPVPSRINAGNWAFFPFYPLLVGAVRTLLPFPTIVTATIVSLLTTYAAAIAAWPLFNKDLHAYTLYAAYLLSGPFSFYFTSFLTEPMFVLTMTLVFVMLARANYLGAGLATAFLSATRIVGVFAALSLVLQAALDHRADTGSWRGLIPAFLKHPNLLLAIFIAPLGAFAYMAFLHFYVGDGLAFQHVQRAWGRPFGNPVFFVWQGLTSWPSEGYWPTSSQWLALAATIGIALTITLAVRRQWAQALFAAIALILPLFAGLASMIRFTSAMVPIVVMTMQVLASRRWLFVLSLVLIVALGYLIPLAWLGNNVALV
ncbi:hypothetical protein [uncultured Devosia sp.]|uniref:hypothetical protein n=1 Tax=uncultured Devosia sp. TaxID=211434 RepID=UPI0035C96CDE